MPIIAATDADQSGVSITAASTPPIAGDAQAEQRGGQRQPGGDQRPEGQQQHDRRDRQADRLRRHLALPGRTAAGRPARTRRPSWLASSAMAISFSPVALGTSSTFAVAAVGAPTAICPSRETWASRGSRRRRCPAARAGEQRVDALAAASRVLRLPDNVDGDGFCCGKRSASRCSAALDSNRGSSSRRGTRRRAATRRRWPRRARRSRRTSTSRRRRKAKSPSRASRPGLQHVLWWG